MLKAVSLAVDIITAHFNSRQVPGEKVVSGVKEIKNKKYGKWGKISWIDVEYNRNVKYYPWVLIILLGKIVLYIVSCTDRESFYL